MFTVDAQKDIGVVQHKFALQIRIFHTVKFVRRAKNCILSEIHSSRVNYKYIWRNYPHRWYLNVIYTADNEPWCCSVQPHTKKKF